MNEDRTCDTGGTNLTRVRSLDVRAMHKQLDALRARHGADTPIGHRCSNLIEMMKNRETATPDLRRDLDKYISRTVAELSALNAEDRGTP